MSNNTIARIQYSDFRYRRVVSTSEASNTSKVVQQIHEMMNPEEVLYTTKCISADLGVRLFVRSLLDVT